jgi:hypothetical protein
MLDIIKMKGGSRQQTARRQQKREHTVDINIRKRRQEDDRTKQAVGGKQQTENSLKYAESRQQWQAAVGRRQTAKSVPESELCCKISKSVVACYANLNIVGMLRYVMTCYDQSYVRNVPLKTRFEECTLGARMCQKWREGQDGGERMVFEKAWNKHIEGRQVFITE